MVQGKSILSGKESGKQVLEAAAASSYIFASSRKGESDESWDSACFPLLRSLSPWKPPLTFKMGLLTPVNLIYKTPPSSGQKCVSWVILDPAK